jgi:Flp pilus assembly protein TadD
MAMRHPKPLRTLKLILTALVLWPRIVAAQQGAASHSDFQVLYERGYLEYSRGNYYDAVMALREAEAIDADSSVLKLLAMSYHGAHQQRLFLLKMNEALRKDPGDFAPLYYLGQSFESDVHDFHKAAEYFTKAIERNPRDFRSHAHLGYCFEMEGSPEQAEAEYKRAIQLAESGQSAYDMPYAGLARLRLAQNRVADALVFAKRAVEIAPREASDHELLAKAWAESGRTAEATNEWKLSSDLDPADATSPYRLYRAYLASGETAKADAALKQYKKIASLYGTN